MSSLVTRFPFEVEVLSDVIAEGSCITIVCFVAPCAGENIAPVTATATAAAIATAERAVKRSFIFLLEGS